MEINSMTEAVKIIMDSYPAGHRYHGNQLHNDVADIYPKAKTMYTDTIQRAMRRYCHHQYVTLDHNDSLYLKVGK